MKFTFKSKAVLALTIAAGLSMAVLSCKKDSSVNDTVTEAEAAELATDAVVPLSGGFVVQVNSSVTTYKTAKFTCGVQKDSSITGAYNGLLSSYNYTLKWNYVLSCTGAVPNQLAFNFTGSSNYDTPRMSSADNSTGGFVMTGLPATSAAYVFNTNYTRNGSQTSKIGRNYSFKSTLNITSTNITVDKTTQQIVSGTSVVAISGSSTSGKTFTFNGTITFLGGNKATLVLNSGASYAIQW